jgi:two-component system NtrC family sensor kinase
MENAMEFLASINRVAPVGIGIVVDRIFRMVNQQFTNLIGYSKDELIGQSARMIYETDSEYERVGREKYDQIKRTGTGTVETRFRRKDGRLVDVLMGSTPLDINDFSKGVTFTVADITDLVQTRLDLMQSLSKTEQAVVVRTLELTDANRHLHNEIEKRKKIETRLIKFQQVLQSTIIKLKKTQSGLIQSEKLASVGYLAAGIAHEINNPTAFVSSNLKTAEGYLQEIGSLFATYRQLIGLLKTSSKEALAGVKVQSILDEIKQAEEDADLDFIMTDLANIFSECREGTDRIQKIVADLKDFAHPGEPERQLTDINQGLDSTINIVWNELKYKAELIKEYGDLPRINCYSQQINQVFMNLLVNAAHAIEKQGTIRVRTCVQGDNIEVHIIDTGRGIPKENLSKIFDPFFTTKEVGKGTGLGLSMAYGIIQKHNGKILVESKIGKGTHFTVVLPCCVQNNLPVLQEKLMVPKESVV